MKTCSIITILSLAYFTSISQSEKYQQEKGFKFEELTFHSAQSDGPSPDISLNLYSDKKIELVRTLYNSKGLKDTATSGTFKGVLNNKDYKKIIALLKNCDLDGLKFADALCCNTPVITLIVSYNEKHKRLKSISPPHKVNPLIDYLTKLATTISLARHNSPIDFEE